MFFSFLSARNFQYLCVSYFPTLLNWAEGADSEKGEISWKEKKTFSWKDIFQKVLPEIYLAVDDDQEEKRENTMYDQIGVGQVHLTFESI